MRSIEERMAIADREVIHVNRETSGNEDFDRNVMQPWKKRQIREGAFAGNGMYSSDEVHKDIESVRNRNVDFAPEGEEAVGLHFAVMEGIDRYKWFGENAKVEFTSRFDDVKNGVDFVVQFSREGEEPVYVAVDTTTNDDRYVLGSKLSRMIQGVREGYLMRVKYHKPIATTQNGGPFRGIFIPGVVLGANQENARLLINSFSRASKMPESGHKTGETIQHALLSEMEQQLAYQLDEAIEAYDRQFHRATTPELVSAYEGWKRQDGVRDNQHVAIELYEQLAQLFEKAKKTSFLQHKITQNVFALKDALYAVALAQKEKSATNPDHAPQKTDDSIMQVLLRPKQVA